MTAQPHARCWRSQDLRVAFGGKEVCAASTSPSPPGEKLALVGESGSGKTVTALSLLRLVQNADDQRRHASALRAGATCCSLPERELRGIRGSDIAMIFQEPMTALNPLFTVGEQIAEVLQLQAGPDAARRPAQAASSCWRTPASPSPQRRADSLSAPALAAASASAP